MTKKRSFLLFAIFIILFSVLFVSSSFFKLQEVEIAFFNKNYTQSISLQDNSFFKSYSQLEPLKSLAKQDIGKSLFLIDKTKYYYKFENQNPYAKLLEVKSKYPNKLVFCVAERKPCYYISSNQHNFILDEEFKILSIEKQLKDENLIQLQCLNKVEQVIDFFDFFKVSSLAFMPGQFVSENNLLLQAIKNLKQIYLNTIVNFNNISSVFFEEDENAANLIIYTKEPYGATFKVKNILSNFDSKLEVLLLDFEKSIIQNEQIKICFGIYEIDDSLKVTWNNL